MVQPELIMIALLVLNLILVIIRITLIKKPSENWQDGFGGKGNEQDDYGQLTYAGCNCSRVATKDNRNAKFNDDSFLYKDLLTL